MKKQIVRLTLIGIVTAGMCAPMLTQRLCAQEKASPPKGDADRPGSAKPGAPSNRDGDGTRPAAIGPKLDMKKVIASAGGVSITAGEFDRFVNSLPPQVHA